MAYMIAFNKKLGRSIKSAKKLFGKITKALVEKICQDRSSFFKLLYYVGEVYA